MEQETKSLAALAWQNGDKVMQRGWWWYVKTEAEQAGILPEVLAEIERLKAQKQESSK